MISSSHENHCDLQPLVVWDFFYVLQGHDTKGKSVKTTIDLHCLIPPKKRGKCKWNNLCLVLNIKLLDQMGVHSHVHYTVQSVLVTGKAKIRSAGAKQFPLEWIIFECFREVAQTAPREFSANFFRSPRVPVSMLLQIKSSRRVWRMQETQERLILKSK